jgi:hypothetical protein
MRVWRAADVLFEVVDGTAVLVDPHGRELFTLNVVGSMVWEALADHHDAAELAAHLEPRVGGVERDRLREDISEFLDELRAAGLVDGRA